MSDPQATLFGSALLCEGHAYFSRCGKYRYSLKRVWDRSLPIITFIMLNPSTADAVKNDPTVERCYRRAVTWGYGCLYVLNIFALRSTDPAALYGDVDPIGEENDDSIALIASRSNMVVCGWGEHGAHMGRGDSVRRQLFAELGVSSIYALKLNKSGQPAHPLYIPYSAMPFEIGG